MKRVILMFMLAGYLLGASCAGAPTKNTGTVVEIATDFGKIKIMLYDETPLHRDNFIKLVNEGIYTDLLFHRVIQGFMIQGGDPDSRNAAPGQLLGNGGPGYTIEAEINPKFFHRRGVLAAAREGDQVNPEKKSSGSQFYIVQGKVFRLTELDSLLLKKEEMRKTIMMQARIKAIEPELYKLGGEGKQQEVIAKISAIKDTVSAEAAKLPPYTFSEEQRKTYTTLGGAPHLDGNYTIFGEVIEGMEVVDAIAKQTVDQHNRPEKDIKFTIKMIK